MPAECDIAVVYVFLGGGSDSGHAREQFIDVGKSEAQSLHKFCGGAALQENGAAWIRTGRKTRDSPA